MEHFRRKDLPRHTLHLLLDSSWDLNQESGDCLLEDSWERQNEVYLAAAMQIECLNRRIPVHGQTLVSGLYRVSHVVIIQ